MSTLDAHVQSAFVVQRLLILRNALKVYHWQTRSYARHKASDELVTKLDAAIDSFVEVFIAKHGRPNFGSSGAAIELRNISDETALELLFGAVRWMTSRDGLPSLLTDVDVDLFTIRDQIVQDLNQAMYLFTFE